MEGDGNLFPDGWFLDADDPSPAPPEADDPSPAPPEADDPSEAPPAKKNKLSLSLKKKARTSRSSVTRFAPPVSEVHFVEAAKGVVPKNTKKNNAWGERAFRLNCSTTSPAVLQLPQQCYNFQPQCYNFHLGSTAPPNH